jgi:hypothetical protein
MKIVWNEKQHHDFKKDLIVVYCWKEKFDIQELILICFKFRTLFECKKKMIKRYYLYLKKKKKNFEYWTLLHLCLKK